MPTQSESDFDMFGHSEVEDRARRRQEAIDRNAEVTRQDAEQNAARKVVADELSARANESLRLAEYRAAGVEPPIMGDVPTRSSLTLLRSLGWTVESMMGRNVLVAPTAAEPRARHENSELGT